MEEIPPGTLLAGHHGGHLATGQDHEVQVPMLWNEPRWFLRPMKCQCQIIPIPAATPVMEDT